MKDEYVYHLCQKTILYFHSELSLVTTKYPANITTKLFYRNQLSYYFQITISHLPQWGGREGVLNAASEDIPAIFTFPGS